MVRAIEGGGTDFGREVASLGAALDGGLPWRGLPRSALHEVAGEAASGFAAALAGRLTGGGGALVWCQTATTERRLGAIYGPGLRRFGIDWRRVVLLRASNEREALWAMEEALRSPAVACAVAEVGRIDLSVSRRLQLAAEAGKGAGILLRPGAVDPTPNAALTRWRAEPALVPLSAGSGGEAGVAGWRVCLWRCKGGAPGNWTVTWDEETLAFALAPRLAPGAREAGGSPARQALSA
jgi:protein ImuA